MAMPADGMGVAHSAIISARPWVANLSTTAAANA
jgi:hypothetical protein